MPKEGQGDVGLSTDNSGEIYDLEFRSYQSIVAIPHKLYCGRSTKY